MPLKDQALTICYVAWNTSTNAGQTGDASNHTLKLVQDGTEANPTNSPTEVDSTNCPGLYKLSLTAGDLNFNNVVMGGKSSTASVVIIPVQIPTDRGVLPSATPTSSGGFVTVGSGTGQLSPVSGGVNVTQINAVATSSVTTINANIGETQPINFTGTGASAYVQVDVKDIAGSAVNTSNAQIGVNLVNITGAAVNNTLAQLGVNLVNIAGSAVSTSTAQLGVNLVNIGGSAVSTSTAQLGVNVVNWGGTATHTTIPPDTVFIRSGTAQAGASSSITLDSGASATNNFYQNQIVLLTGGTGAGQSAIIASYVGSTKVATIVGTWATNPSSSTTFLIMPFGSITTTVSGGVNVTQWNGSNVVAPNVAGVPIVDLGYTLGTASTGQAGSVGIDWAQVANKTSTVALTNTTISTSQAVASVSGSVGSISGVTFPSGFSSLTTAAIATATWTDTTSSDFTTASSIGKSLYTSGNAPGAASGLALVGSNMGTVSSVTGNVGGNVTGSVGSVTGAVGSVTSAVTVSLTQTLNAARALDSIGDTSLTLNDALQCAVAGITAQVDASSGTTCVWKTASTATTLRTKTLTLISPPSTVPDKAV